MTWVTADVRLLRRLRGFNGCQPPLSLCSEELNRSLLSN
jgi:hypothetical protein